MRKNLKISIRIRYEKRISQNEKNMNQTFKVVIFYEVFYNK